MSSKSNLTVFAQELRKNMTKEERHLWYDFLKSLPLSFNRQKVIGNYIVDFYCASAGIVVELDGSQHYEDGEKARDKVRDEYLASQGIRVLRYPNNEVKQNFRAVCEDILRELGI